MADLLRAYYGSSLTLDDNVTKRNGDLYVTTDNKYLTFHLGGSDYTINSPVAAKVANALTIAGKTYDGSQQGGVTITLTDFCDANGKLPLGVIPNAALERLYVGAANQTLAQILASGNVQAGDTVKLSDGKMYIVYDNSGTLAGEEFVAGSAATAAVANSVLRTLTLKLGSDILVNAYNGGGANNWTATIPDAGSGVAHGLITNDTQTIYGAKTFNSTISGTITNANNAATAAQTAGSITLSTSGVGYTASTWKGQSSQTITIGVFRPYTSTTNVGLPGFVPAPDSSASVKFLRGDGTWAVPTNTTYTAGTGLTLSSGEFSITATGVTAETYGPSQTSATTAAHGTKIKVPKITVNAQGQITAVSEIEFTAQNTNTTYSAASGGGLSLSGTAFSIASQSGYTAGTFGPTQTTATSAANGTKIKVPKITVDSHGIITGISEIEFTSVNTDTNTTYSADSTLNLSNNTFGLKSLYTPDSSWSDNTLTVGPSAAYTEVDGGTFTVPQVSIDKYGRVTALTSRTITVSDKNNTYAAGTGLTLSNGTFSITATGVTAETYGPTQTTATTAANGTKIKVPKLTVNAQGQITAISTIEFTAQNTNTTYSAASGGGLSLSGTAFSIAAQDGYTAGTFGPTQTAATSASNGTKIKVPKITVDSHGIITGISEIEFTAVNTDNNTTYSAASGGGLTLSGTAFSIATQTNVTASTYGPEQTTATTASHGTKIKIPKITVDSHGIVTGITTIEFTAQNQNTTYSAASGGGLSLSSNAFSIATTGVTAASYGPTQSSATTLHKGDTFNVAKFTVNNKGQLTAASDITFTVGLTVTQNADFEDGYKFATIEGTDVYGGIKWETW